MIDSDARRDEARPTTEEALAAEDARILLGRGAARAGFRRRRRRPRRTPRLGTLRWLCRRPARSRHLASSRCDGKAQARACSGERNHVTGRGRRRGGARQQRACGGRRAALTAGGELEREAWCVSRRSVVLEDGVRRPERADTPPPLLPPPLPPPLPPLLLPPPLPPLPSRRSHCRRAAPWAGGGTTLERGSGLAEGSRAVTPPPDDGTSPPPGRGCAGSGFATESLARAASARAAPSAPTSPAPSASHRTSPPVGAISPRASQSAGAHGGATHRRSS